VAAISSAPVPLAAPADDFTAPFGAPPHPACGVDAKGTPGEAILHRQAQRESAARTYARSLPVVPVRARGMTVEGADGRRYLDCLSGAGTLALGHNHPVVLEAIKDVLDSGAPLHVLDLATPVKDAFVTALFETLPPQLADRGRIQFCGPAGTDAVEAALKLTRIATGRGGLLAFTGAYHGMTAGALAATGNTAARTAIGESDARVTRLPYPYDYRCPFGIGGDRGAELSARWTAALLDDPHSGVRPPAAMLLEAVQGEGGMIPAPDAWLRRMRELCTAHGIPLVVDEVQTGVGRTGTFWAIERSGVVPDVMVLSKAIGGSLPLAVIVYREELDTWQPGAHAGTFRGNQLAMAAGTATLRFVRRHALHERAETVGSRILSRLRGLAAHHSCIGDVRGRGLMIGVELVDADAEPDDHGALPTAPRLAARVQQEALRRGLIVELGGRHNSVVRLLPPLTITDEQAEAVLDRLASAVDAAVGAAVGAAASAAPTGRTGPAGPTSQQVPPPTAAGPSAVASGAPSTGPTTTPDHPATPR
jgi:diaminobutyrate-2-oxoglutarate transaminase